MIRARTRMYGSRMVVVMAGPTHCALAVGGAPRLASQRVRAADRDLFGDALLALGRARAVALLASLPEPFDPLLG